MAWSEYTRTDHRGVEWCFRVFAHSQFTVAVHVRDSHGAHLLDGGDAVLLKYTDFNNEFLHGMPRFIIDAEIARAQLFSQTYPWVKPYVNTDPTRNTTRAGIRMVFRAPHYTEELSREDARTLWRHITVK
jgi:hypothetical protein